MAPGGRHEGGGGAGDGGAWAVRGLTQGSPRRPETQGPAGAVSSLRRPWPIQVQVSGGHGQQSPGPSGRGGRGADGHPVCGDVHAGALGPAVRPWPSFPPCSPRGAPWGRGDAGAAGWPVAPPAGSGPEPLPLVTRSFRLNAPLPAVGVHRRLPVPSEGSGPAAPWSPSRTWCEEASGRPGDSRVPCSSPSRCHSLN